MLTQKKTKAIMLGDTPVKRVMFRDKQIWPELGPAPTNLVGVAGTLKATLTWTSATGESGVTWTEEKLVRKEGSAPQGSMDGTTVATITTKDTYATNGYEDTGLDSTKTYYYKVFAVYDNGTERGSSDVNVTPTAPTFTGLCFTAQEAGSQVQLNRNGSPTAVNLEISSDGDTWSDYTIGNPITLANIGDKVYMRNKSETDTGFSTSSNYCYKFAMTGTIGASGDVTSLLNKNGTTTLSASCLTTLFQNCTSLTTAPELPATTLAKGCYMYMFRGCTNLTTAPALPATTLAERCYSNMFEGCTSLTTAPALQATSLATYCCYGMFYGCTSLTTAPELPVTTLASYCYNGMFEGCTSLTTVPNLPATSLAEGCYLGMFSKCTNLITLPELPATTLARECYRNMFYQCKKIKVSTTQTGEYQTPYRIPTTGTGTTATDALNGMFSNTGGTFTGTPTINTTYYLSNGQQPTLLSYEEIKAMWDNAMQTGQTSDLLALQTELNKYPSDYYNKFKSENKIAILEGEQGSGEYSPVLDPDGTAIWKTGLFINNARTYWDYI